MAVFRLADKIPNVDASAYVSDSAQVIGWVDLAAGSSVWFNATLRGDNEWIRIGPDSNVQEGSVLHTDPGHPLTVGEGVTVGHQAMLHGCTIGDHSLVGIQSVILNGAVIGRHCLIGAGAIIPEGREIPDRSLVLGAPGKVVRQLSDAEVDRLKLSARSYVDRAQLFRNQLFRI